MKTLIRFVSSQLITIFIFSAFILSCSGDRIIEAEQTNNDQEDPVILEDSIIVIDGTFVPAIIICNLGLIITETDTMQFSEYHGTICCVSGPDEAEPGDTLSFVYNTNLSDSARTVIWDVTDGAITLIDGQNTPDATFKCESNFNGGTVRGWGKSIYVFDNMPPDTLGCSAGSYIRLRQN